MKGENTEVAWNKDSSPEKYERYYKYEDGDLIDTECYKDLGCNESKLQAEDQKLLNDEPDYQEESNDILDVTKTFE
ncbi:hypothetical protein [Oceanobacillus neutriphilus]|uniref:Uncharacterized protein n=1 Tax=Oceanobacillus neutriphilus TaxID=531815 RepID=A0ABQ2P061_9BACI|nr:hypothetical protein [Oceanobacillus neutriphilus]GGP14752.1 hypothetical protein GCM10011346_40020 [Oceanobacillus neutriphilus]